METAVPTPLQTDPCSRRREEADPPVVGRSPLWNWGCRSRGGSPPRSLGGYVRSSDSGWRRAFTLVELLVVIAVIGILAGLLLPGLARARSAADGARCVSNLHQSALAVQLYWDEHTGVAFSERTIRTNGGWRYWFGWLQDGAEGQRSFDATQGALWPYFHGRGVEVCPSLNRASPLFKAKARGAAYGYAYNLLLGPRGLPGRALTSVARPAGLAVFADGGQVNDFQEPASAEHPMLEEFYYFDTNTVSSTVHFRHRGRAQVAFADGHLGTERAENGSEDSRVAGQLCGRLRAELVLP